MRLSIATVIGFLACAVSPVHGQTKQLSSSVELAPPPPTVAIAERSAGASPVERFRNRERNASSSSDLVLIVRLKAINSPDRVTIARAVRKGTTIDIDIEVRRFTGSLSANVVTEPFVEVELGQLSVGTYEVRVDATTFEFDDFDHPEAAVKKRSELGTTMSFQVR
jgi:hypothetical protein